MSLQHKLSGIGCVRTFKAKLQAIEIILAIYLTLIHAHI